MAKITKKQYLDINAKCDNNFILDLQHFCVWGEKQLGKTIKITDTIYINATIFFREKIEHFRSIGHVACVRFDKLIDLHPDSDDEYKMYRSIELKTIELTTDPVARRNMNILYEFTKKYSDDVILEELKEKIEEIRSAA